MSRVAGIALSQACPIFVLTRYRESPVPPKPVTFGEPAAQQEAKNMSEKAQNVQDVFLNHLRKNKTPVTIFLVNGVKLQGIVTWFDNFSVLLRRDGHSQLVYKHAISTIMPVTPVQLFDGDKADAAG